MTDPRMTPTNDAPVTVEQCDREAAAEAYGSPAHRAAILAGKHDDWPFVRASATYRYRLSNQSIAVQALQQISTLRPAGDVETCAAPRKLVERMERIALAALASAPAEPRLNPTPIEALADTFTGKTEVDRLAITLMRAFGKAEPKEGISQHPESYVATFADMARAVIASAPAVDESRAVALVRRIAAREPWQAHYGRTWEDEAADIVAGLPASASAGDGVDATVVTISVKPDGSTSFHSSIPPGQSWLDTLAAMAHGFAEFQRQFEESNKCPAKPAALARPRAAVGEREA